MNILNEEETIQKLKKGYSLARFGDGEFFKIMLESKGISKLQDFNLVLQKKLFNIFSDPIENLLIGIPSLKYKKPWVKNFHNKFEEFIKDKKCREVSTFVSAFFSRPSLVGKATKNYFKLVRSIWKDKHIVIINFNPTLVWHDLFNIDNYNFILIDRRNCFSCYDNILNSCSIYDDSIFLVSAGPTASCLAYDIAKTGRQCIDIGQIAFEYSLFMGDDELEKYTSQNSYRRK